MATVASFTATPTTIPAGGTTRLAATFNTAPAIPPSPDRVLNGILKDPSGANAATAQVTVQGTPGTPAEPTPTVVAGNTPGQWCIVVDSGTLTSVGGNAFDWRP